MGVIVKGDLEAAQMWIDGNNPLLGNGKGVLGLLCDRKWPGEVQKWAEVRRSRGDKNQKAYHQPNSVATRLALLGFKYNYLLGVSMLNLIFGWMESRHILLRWGSFYAYSIHVCNLSRFVKLSTIGMSLHSLQHSIQGLLCRDLRSIYAWSSRSLMSELGWLTRQSLISIHTPTNSSIHT